MATALALGFVVLGLMQSRVETGVDSFVPSGDSGLKQYRELSRSFGGAPVVVLLESKQPGQLLSQTQLMRMLKLEGKLSRLPDVAAVYGPATTVNQIAGQMQELMAKLSGRRDAIRAQARQQAASKDEVAAAVERATAEFDRRYGQLLVQALPAGLPTLSNQSFVNSVIYAGNGKPRAQWRFVVPSKKAVTILVRPRQGLDQAATERLVGNVRAAVQASKLETIRTTVSGIPALAAALGNTVRHEIPLLGSLALLAVGLCFFLVPWRRKRQRLLPLVSAVSATALTVAILGWLHQPLSVGVVAFLPVLLGVGSDYATYLAQRARRRVVLAVACATAVSFGALAVVPLPFVRDLGIVLAIGVMLAFLIGLLLTGSTRGEAADAEQPARNAPSKSNYGGQTTTNMSTRIAALCAVALVAAAGWASLPKLSVQSDVESLAGGIPALADAQHIEHVMGSSGQIALVLEGRDVTSPKALAWMRKAREVAVVRHGDEMRPALSLPGLLGFLGSSPSAGQIKAAMGLLPSYLTSAVVRPDDKQSVLYFGVDIDDAAQLRQLHDEILRQLPPPPAGYQVELTGLPVLAARSYELVSDNRYLINGIGIAAVGLVLALALRRRSDAARAVATATLTAGVCFFGLWLTGVSLSPITVALGPLVAAVGCEFAVLLAEAARRQDRRLRESVMLVATVSTVGYAILGFSGLAVIQQFGLLLAAAVVLSLMIALLVVWSTTAHRLHAKPTENVRHTSRLIGATR